VLSFLGLGIQPPAPSLGTMLSDAQQFASRAPWAAVMPGLAIMLLTLAFNINYANVPERRILDVRPRPCANPRYAGKSFDTTRTYRGTGEDLRPSTSSWSQRHHMKIANAPKIHHWNA